jgi:hypothetical protein
MIQGVRRFDGSDLRCKITLAFASRSAIFKVDLKK